MRFHLLRARHFATSLCRVVIQRDLGPEATATALLAQVLQSATARHPTRQALAHRLGDLYGAALHLTVAKLGDRQLLSGTLEWPTAHLPRSGPLLASGFRLLREVWTRPKRMGRARAKGGAAGIPLDPDLVATERRNLGRTLRALKDDKYRYAAARCVAETCRGEPHALDPLGREEDLAAATPEELARLHARLLATAPLDVFFVGDLPWRHAVTAVKRHLLWDRGGAPTLARVRPSVSRPAPRRPRRVVETDVLSQAQLLATWRARVRPTSPRMPAAHVLAGVLGGGSSSRLFHVVRERHGLCYFSEAGWSTAKGYLIVHTGIDPADEGRVRRQVGRLVREVAGGVLEPAAWRAFREAVASETAALGDDRAALIGWYQGRALLGLEPSPRRWLERILAVTPADVRRLGRLLGPDTTYLLLPAAPSRPAREGAPS